MFTDEELLAKVAPMVLAGLKEKGHKVSFLEPAKQHRTSRIVVDGVRVPFDVQRQAGSWGRFTGKKTVRIDWLWMSNDHLNGAVQMKARSFQQSKNRPDTEGFDIPKIVEHIEKWASEWTRLKEICDQKEDHQEQWTRVVKLLRQSFPEASDRLKLKATTKGIEVRGLFGHKDVEAMLKVLGKGAP
jgi:hypothetical protein